MTNKKLYILLTTLLVSLISVAQENGGPYTPDANTVLLMHFENNVQNSANVGVNGIIHGSGVSYETSVDGHGKCIRLDNSTAGSQSWIEVPFYNELNFIEEFSIECWFKINSWGEAHTNFPFLIKKGEGWPADYEIVLQPAGNGLQANLNCQNDEYNRGSDAGTVKNIIQTNKWYHISVTFNVLQEHMYLLIRDENFNEYFASRGYVPTPPFNSNDKLYIGFGNGGNTCFDGYIDELRISNKYRKYRDDILSIINPVTFKDSIPPLLGDKWKVYFDPIRMYFPIDTITGEPHKGNSCGMTMMTRIIHYWEYPRFPAGQLDYWTDNFHWLADYDNSEYLFDLMPNTFSANPDEAEYGNSSFLTVQVSTATRSHYDNMSGMPQLLKDHFLFKDSVRFISREEYTKQEWINIFKNELNHGRPIMIGGLAERFWNGGAGHFYICDGYDAENKFHTDISMGNDEFWVDIDSFPYGMCQDIIIFAEPDWQGKTLSLEYPKGDEYFKKQTEVEIKWISTNINSVLLEYSSDAGKNWQTIIENVTASNGKYTWTIPDLVTKEYKIRVSDADDGNIYRRSKTFSVFNQQIITFNYPLNNTYFQAETTQPIYWQSEGIPAFKLEYSTGQHEWSLLCDSITSATGIYSCKMPVLETEIVLLKATNLTNGEVFFESDTFRVLPEGLIGGVYKEDKNNILLMHFEEDVLNSVSNNVLPYESQDIGSYVENFNLHLGKAFRIDNSETSAGWHCLMVQHNNELNLGNNWTIETWVKINSLGTNKLEYPLIFEKGESFGIWLDGNGNGFGGYAKFNDQSEAGFFQNRQLEQNKWYHVAITSNSNTRKIKFYVHDDKRKLIYENSRDFPSSGTGELNHSDLDIFIGGVNGGSNIQFDGWLDELRISKATTDYSTLVNKTDKIFIQDKPDELTCYPNPVTFLSKIYFQIDKTSKVKVLITDINGRVLSVLIDNELEQGSYAIPLPGKVSTTKGIYILSLLSNDRNASIKLIVQ